jgi:RNA polymerase sigma-70 factor (ECF subfamily)
VSSRTTNDLYSIFLGKPGDEVAIAAGDRNWTLAEAPDEILIDQISRNNRQALACLFQRYAKLVRNLAKRILQDATEAEDLTQDLFLYIQRRGSIFDATKSSARSWIVQMTYHRAIERRRYLTVRQFYAGRITDSRAEQVVGIPTIETDYSAEAVFGRNGLEQVLRALTEDQRLTLELHFFEGCTFAEISVKLGQSLGNVRHHYYRALQKLREHVFGNNVRGK